MVEYFKRKKIKLKIMLITIILTIIVCYFYKNFYIKNTAKIVNASSQQIKIEKVDNSIQEKEIKQIKNDEISELKNKLIMYEHKINDIEEEIELLKEYTKTLENQNPIYNEKNLLIVILLNKIQQYYSSNKNFINEFESLKTLIKNKPNMLELVLNLEQYANNPFNIEVLNNTFREEYRQALIKDNKNFFKKFINENIQIRNTKNTDSSDNTNKIINSIENNIKLHNFENAIYLIEENKYHDTIFKNTYKYITNINKFNNILNSIYDLVYKSY